MEIGIVHAHISFHTCLRFSKNKNIIIRKLGANIMSVDYRGSEKIY